MRAKKNIEMNDMYECLCTNVYVTISNCSLSKLGKEVENMHICISGLRIGCTLKTKKKWTHFKGVANDFFFHSEIHKFNAYKVIRYFFIFFVFFWSLVFHCSKRYAIEIIPLKNIKKNSAKEIELKGVKGRGR